MDLNPGRCLLKVFLHVAPVCYLMLAVAVAGCSAAPWLLALYSVGATAVHFACLELYGRLREEDGLRLERAAWRADAAPWRPARAGEGGERG
jgi:hypothetical protein